MMLFMRLPRSELISVRFWRRVPRFQNTSFSLRNPGKNRQDGKGNRPHLRGNGKGLKGKHDSSSHAEDPPPERATRGGKGKKGATASAGKWLSTLFMEGKQHTLCMRYQQGQCKDPSTCRYLHRCAVPKSDGTACGGKHPASQHVGTPHYKTRFSDQRESTEVVYRASRFVCQHAQPVLKPPCSPSQQSLPGRAPRHHLLCQLVISVSPLVCRFWRNTFPTPRTWSLIFQILLSHRLMHTLTSALSALTMARESVFSSVQNSSPTSFAF